MNFTGTYTTRRDEIIQLFRDSFAAFEGAEEGALISGLVFKMLSEVAEQDIFVFSALQEDSLRGTIVFTRMGYTQDDRTVFILSPVAVATDSQGKGVGQSLIRYGIEALRNTGVDVVLTYGDVNFYAKTGFAQITQDIARAPLPLAFPQGWLGQSLGAAPFAPLKGQSTCVAPLNDPALW